MLQIENPEDFVLSTGETHSVREFVELAFEYAGINILWKGKKNTIDEIGVDLNDETKTLVKIDPNYFRPTEVDILIGDSSKAKIKFKDLVKEMVEFDLNAP